MTAVYVLDSYTMGSEPVSLAWFERDSVELTLPFVRVLIWVLYAAARLAASFSIDLIGFCTQ